MDEAVRTFREAIALSDNLAGAERLRRTMKHLLEEADDLGWGSASARVTIRSDRASAPNAPSRLVVWLFGCLVVWWFGGLMV